MREKSRAVNHQSSSLWDALAQAVLNTRGIKGAPWIALAILLFSSVLPWVHKSAIEESARPATALGSYTAVVLDQVSKLPVERLEVVTDDSAVRGTITDSQGRFTLLGPAGKRLIVTVRQQASILSTVQAIMQTSSPAVDYVYVRIPSPSAPLSLQSLKPAARRTPVVSAEALHPIPALTPASVAITGQVVDWTNNSPLAGATVRVAGLDIETTTDASGRFVLSGLNAGVRLRLKFIHNHYDTQERVLDSRSQELSTVALRFVP